MIAVREKDIPDCKSRTQTLNFLWEVPRVPARDYRAKFTRDLMAWKKQTLLPNWKLTDGLPQSPLFHASQVTHTQYWEMPPARVQKCHDSNIRFLKWKCDYEHKTGKEGSKQASKQDAEKSQVIWGQVSPKNEFAKNLWGERFFYCCILELYEFWNTRKETADGSLQALLKHFLDPGSLIPRREGGVRRLAGLRPARLGPGLPLPSAPPNFPQEIWFNERI